MALTREDVRKIATLARLRFAPDEEERLAGQLAAIVEYIDQLQSISGMAPEGGVTGVRESDDLPQPGLPRERFLANAPASLDGFLLVPAVKGNE
jgi:aspartyl-tRNA(Asn)/glutamyl-tRNA(Gln) amidotransferase subunit C